MNKGSEFLPVLAAGIIILGLLFLLFGGGIILPSVPAAKKYVTIEEIPEVTEEIGWVGMAEQEFKHIPIARDFSVSYTAEDENVVDMKNFTVSSGLFSAADKKISFATKGDLESAKISFAVQNTNLYGPLIIVLNGVVLYQNQSLLGKKEFSFNKSLLKEENVFEIKAGSSGWKFWAPTIYVLDLNLTLGYLGFKPSDYDFSLGDEALAMTLSRLYAFGGKQGLGNLIVKVNGVEIYRDSKTNILQDFSFKDTGLKQGKNKIEFSTEQNTKYDIKEAELIIFYQPVYKTKTFWYNMSSSDYSALQNKNLTLKFYVERIAGDVVSIPIYITDSRGFVHTIIPQGILREKQFYSVLLTKNELYTGDNKIEFSVEKGGILIKNVTVE